MARIFHVTSRSKPANDSDMVLSGDRPSEITSFEAEMVSFFVDSADMLRIPKSVGAIYGIVFASLVPLSFADITARLNLSKGSVSQGLRVLREVGALKEVSSQADRVELFTPDLEMRKLVSRFLENRLEKQLVTGSARLAHLRSTLPESYKGDMELLLARLTSLQDWHDKARALLPLANTFLRLGT